MIRHPLTPRNKFYVRRKTSQHFKDKERVKSKIHILFNLCGPSYIYTIGEELDIISLISYKKILDIVTFTLMSDREKVTLNNHILVWYRTNTDSK